MGGGNANADGAAQLSGEPQTTDAEQAALNEFLRLYLEDQAAGRERELRDYQALFPGHEARMARELELLRQASTPGSDGAAPTLGRTFGPYVLVRPLGRGGQGRVWLARDTRLARPVALKLLTELAALSPQTLERFRREAQIASRLSDSGICTVFETGSEQGIPFIAMRYVEGQTLAQRLAGARAAGAPPLALPPEPGREGLGEGGVERVARLVERIARSLHEAHEASVVHRDVKPGNVIVGADGLPVLLDFGLARVHDGELATLTHTGDALGTPAYMSPEQLGEGSRHLDRRADVYSLGVVLYECLTLHRPFEAESRELLQRSILTGEPPDPRRYLPGLGEDLRTILATALEKDRARRYPTAAAMAEDLRRFRAGEPILARAPSAVYRMRKLVRRHRVLAWSALLVGVVVLAAGALVLRSVLRENAFAREIGRLSAQRDLDELVGLAERLAPARPALVPELEDWVRRARGLLDDLPHHEATLTELRQRALSSSPPGDDPRRAVLENLRAQRTGLLRQLAGSRADSITEPSAEEVGVDWSRTPDDPMELFSIVNRLVDSSGRIFGAEPRALVLARRALTLASESEAPVRASVRESLALALLANGRYEEAVGEARRAVLEGGPGGLDAEGKAVEGEALELEWSAAGYRSAGQDGLIEELVGELDRRARRLEAALEEAREWHFASTQDRWWHDQLATLVRGLQALADPEVGLLRGISPEHGWGIERRLAWARAIEERSVRNALASRLWSEAIDSIADPASCPRYEGLRIRPQTGLLPIGRDPVSGLWEFAGLQTGEPATRGPDGVLRLRGETGIVFVLLPGGTFLLGAQSQDPAAANYDPQADSHEKPEGPVIAVDLAPFFLSKFEMTQGQWLRATGANPSRYSRDALIYDWNERGSPFGWLDPVEDVSWNSCTEAMDRLGLLLPTEAQWEYAARGGTSTPWWTGMEPLSLQGAANIADQFGKRHGLSFWPAEPGFEDGYTAHAPVGSFRANPFGLHDVCGNVWEFCQDGFSAYALGCRPGDGLRLTPQPRTRVMRGGSFLEQAVASRSARRDGQQPEQHNLHIGLRPARALD